MLKVRASEIVGYSQLAPQIAPEASIADALRSMNEHKTDALLVIRTSSKGLAPYSPSESFAQGDFVLAAQGDFGRFIGVIDVHDIAAFAAFYPEKPVKDKIEKVFESLSVDSLMGYYERIMNGDSMNGLFVISPLCPVERMIELFSSGVKRLYVSSSIIKDGDAFDEVTLKEITPLSLFSTVWTEYSQQIATQLKKVVFSDKLTLDSKSKTDKLIVLDEEASVRSALQKLMYSRVNTIAIVDPEGVLIRNLSASDILTMFTHNNGLQAVLVSSIRECFADEFSKLIVSHPEDNVFPVLNKLEASTISRVWLVDGAVKPVCSFGIDSIITFLA